jgi:hypothetical protein
MRYQAGMPLASKDYHVARHVGAQVLDRQSTAGQPSLATGRRHVLLPWKLHRCSKRPLYKVVAANLHCGHAAIRANHSSHLVVVRQGIVKVLLCIRSVAGLLLFQCLCP